MFSCSLKVSKDMEGTYQAVFTPGKGATEPKFASRPIKIIVTKERPPVFTNRPRDNYYLSPGDSVEIPCQAIGVPKPDITFKMVNVLFLSSEHTSCITYDCSQMDYQTGTILQGAVDEAISRSTLKTSSKADGDKLVLRNVTENDDRMFLCVAGAGNGGSLIESIIVFYCQGLGAG